MLPGTPMAKLVLYSLCALVLVLLGARACGVTPQQIEDRQLLAQLNAAEGASYRAAQAARPGVVSLPGGLLLEVLELGEGETPVEEDWVEVHYRGWRIDGREFDNSWRRGEPAVLPISLAIPGWRQALVSMPEGSRLRLVVPPELAYGPAGGGIIGPEETVIFDLALLGVVTPPAAEVPDPAQLPVPNLR
jgi:FKBP-type peptidyl-prolyl cis-trans isomerase FkpA/FKBP-type peptidyl-prolyl cis-trans isomerase FklB